MPFFDTHTHLFDDRFSGDLPSVIERAETAGVVGILAVGIDAPSSATSVRQAATYRSVHAAVGLQPNNLAAAEPSDWDTVRRLADAPKVVAIGETGLDRYWDDTPFAQQEEFFARHLELARQRQLPVVIHCREAEADVLRMLRDEFERLGPVRGVMHSFTGDSATLEACLAMGLHISFAGMVTYKTGAKLRALAVRVPAERLLIETDCPYLAPIPHRGQRNEPAHVVHTAACLAQERGESIAEFSMMTTANARKLFNLRD